MKSFFLRASVLIALKSITYNLLLLVTGLIVASRLSALAYSILFACVYAVLTFVFAEFVFTGDRLRLPVFLAVLIFGYVLDALISISFFSWYYDRNLFLEQTAGTHVIFGMIYLVAMSGAYVLRKRMKALRGGLAEGLA